MQVPETAVPRAMASPPDIITKAFTTTVHWTTTLPKHVQIVFMKQNVLSLSNDSRTLLFFTVGGS
ncbi:hypothetical protein N7520_007923 [Penicillium odoratum]|uniref:uncharacterized protein n=1 Tax=Penicillium odoratum TaxID=1167516 RepID=UPI0025482CD5|nr:uncharacterized protein N7520_007923 [Penicillium odoratum]KAJ5760767.1 hypothetical protein N7520_007923 [Penicillium odoratum]